MLCWFVVEKTKRASLPVLAWWQHRVLLSLERENRSAGARGAPHATRQLLNGNKSHHDATHIHDTVLLSGVTKGHDRRERQCAEPPIQLAQSRFPGLAISSAN